jgi:hypothetical protein
VIKLSCRGNILREVKMKTLEGIMEYWSGPYWVLARPIRKLATITPAGQVSDC